MSSTSNITHWTCQCGVQVPLGVSHRCGGQPIEVTYNLPWPTELIASQQARIAALEALIRRLDWSNIHTHYGFTSTCDDCTLVAMLTQSQAVNG